MAKKETTTKEKTTTQKTKVMNGDPAVLTPSEEKKTAKLPTMSKGDRVVAMIHFNTPELTEAAILSLRKQTGMRYDVTVFDNSDRRPFTAKMDGVTVIDNTKGQVIDFEKELAKYPDKCWELAWRSNYGSAKHIMSVQKLWELLPGGFILMESDILLTKNINFLWDENFAACGKAQWFRGRTKEKDRLLPFLCYLNVPKLTANGARYFDPARCWALSPGGMVNPANWYDTGASLLEDIIKTKPALVARLYRDLDHYYVHYTGGSWRQNDVANQKAWLEANKPLWTIPENKDVKLFVCAHQNFEPVVTNPIYETIDSRKGGDSINIPATEVTGTKTKTLTVPGPFYSELLHFYRISQRKDLPKYIGFVQYRKYFSFFDDLPDIPAVIENHGMITPTPVDLKMPMHRQWGTWGNIEDLDLATEIVNEKYPELAKTWNANLQKKTMHPGSLHIMATDDWKKMVACAWDVANEWLRRIGGDIDKRIQENPQKYHLDEMEFTDQANERRVGGNICERIVSAWADCYHPNAAQFPLVVTAAKIAPNFEKPDADATGIVREENRE